MITKLTAAQQAVLKEIDGGKELKFCWATKLYHYKSPQFCFTGPKKAVVKTLINKGYLRLESCNLGEQVSGVTRLFPDVSNTVPTISPPEKGVE